MNEPWRETLKKLLETPPAPGVEVINSPIETLIDEMNAYIKSEIAVFCDPDALEQTARKNKELMDMLDDINAKLESGALVEPKYGRWLDIGNNNCKCSECGSVRYGNSAVNIIKYNLAPFCEKCGANMTADRIDLTMECKKRHFQFHFPCDAKGGCIGKGKCVHTSEGVFMQNDQTN